MGDIDGNEMTYDETLNDYKNVWNACTIYIVLFVVTFIGTSSTFIYFHWYLKRDNIPVKFNTNTQTTTY